MEFRTRREAIKLNLKYYYTGKPCPHGHIDERLVSDYGCRECKRIAVKKWRNENLEKAREGKRISSKKYIKNNTIRHKKWRQKNRQKVRETTKKYYRENKEKCAVMAINWRKNNPEANRANILNYQSRRRKSFGVFKKEDVLALKNKQKNLCVYCKTNISNNYHVDHIMPLSRGGNNTSNNLQILCPSCNCSKGSKTDKEFKEFLQL